MSGDAFVFMAAEPGEFPEISERDQLLAACIATQQQAGFGNRIDAREWSCPNCKAPGFNSGWGAIFFTCGAEVLTDGEVSQPCGPR